MSFANLRIAIKFPLVIVAVSLLTGLATGITAHTRFSAQLELFVGQRVAVDELDQVNSAYRFLIADHFPFGNRAVIRLEHGAVNQTKEHYSGVVYWYGVDSPTLVLSDELNVCNERSIQAHRYTSPTAQAPAPRRALISAMRRSISPWVNTPFSISRLAPAWTERSK